MVWIEHHPQDINVNRIEVEQSNSKNNERSQFSDRIVTWIINKPKDRNLINREN